MRATVLLLPLLLCACASSYDPIPIEIDDQGRYDADVTLCQTAAAKYQPHVNLGSIGAATLNGASQNSSNAVINPLVPVVGAIGGAVSALTSGTNIVGQARRNVAKHCLEDKVRIDHSAIIANPDN